jgi:hypothetical protein
VFIISALTGEGCRELTYAVMEFLQRTGDPAMSEAEELAAAPE